MSNTFKIVLSVASLLAFILLFVCIQAEMDGESAIVAALVLLLASVGAMRIIWKKDKIEK